MFGCSVCYWVSLGFSKLYQDSFLILFLIVRAVQFLWSFGLLKLYWVAVELVEVVQRSSATLECFRFLGCSGRVNRTYESCYEVFRMF